VVDKLKLWYDSNSCTAAAAAVAAAFTSSTARIISLNRIKCATLLLRNPRRLAAAAAAVVASADASYCGYCQKCCSSTCFLYPIPRADAASQGYPESESAVEAPEAGLQGLGSLLNPHCWANQTLLPGPLLTHQLPLGRCWSCCRPARPLLLLPAGPLLLLLLLFLQLQKSFEQTVQRVWRGLKCAACAMLVASLLLDHYPQARHRTFLLYSSCDILHRHNQPVTAHTAATTLSAQQPL
jgi:hypothetical protein